MNAVLIVEDEQSIRDTLLELFQAEGTEASGAADLQEAMHLLTRQAFSLIVTDIRLRGKRDGGLQVMGAAGLLSPSAPVIALTAFPDADNRMASRRLGATYFLEKPVDLHTIAKIAARHGVATAIDPEPDRDGGHPSAD